MNRRTGVGRHKEKQMKTTSKIVMLLLILATCCVPSGLSAKNKKIVVQPAEAKIYVDGSYVADGSYFLKFNSRNDMYMIKVEAQGYVTKEMKIFKSDTRNVIPVDLKEDDSIEGSVASNLANKYFTINVRQGVDEATAWKMLTQVVLNYFDEIKTSDRASGFMNTPWVEFRFPMAEIKVRTMVQIKQITSDGLAYQIRVSSETAPLDSRGDHGFKPWPRVLKHYEPIISEMQQRIGDN